MNKLNRKGFTLVELLAVIVLMAILLTVAVPAITKVGKSLKTESFCSKIQIIEAAASEYANDYFTGKENLGSNKVSLDNISLTDLVNMGYLKSDVSIGTDSKGNPTTCNLYKADSKCILDPRDSSSMDYETVRIWSANNKLYATYRYKESDINKTEDSQIVDGVCGSSTLYEEKISNSNDHLQSEFAGNNGFFNNPIKLIKVKEGNEIYGWSNYYSYRTTRPDKIPGNYYIGTVDISYELGNHTIIELSIGNYFDVKLTSGDSKIIDFSENHLGNADISFRAALNSTTRVNDAFAKVTKVIINWRKIT